MPKTEKGTDKLDRQEVGPEVWVERKKKSILVFDQPCEFVAVN
jgi:hypothetical protein